jgi:hypothetical protein
MDRMRSLAALRTSVFCALVGFGSSACDESVDDSFRTDLITVRSMRVERVVASESALFFIDVDLHNRTNDTVNNFFWSRFRADTASSAFELDHNQGPNVLVGCTSPDPFDIPPGQTKTTRMRLDLRTDPARLDIACEFDPSMLGFLSGDSRVYEAPRSGSSPPSDFLGSVELELKGTMNNAQCDPDDCPAHARVVGSAEVAAPQ